MTKTRVDSYSAAFIILALILAATGQWSPRADDPRTVFTNAAAVLGGKVYGLGGQTGWTTPTPVTTGLYEYDPATDRWTTKAPLPYTVSYTDVLTHAGKLS